MLSHPEIQESPVPHDVDTRKHPTGPTASPEPGRAALSYRDAGVNIDAGEALVEAIQPYAARTKRPGVLGGLGGFGALFELPLDRYKQPVLVSGTDGVGTKRSEERRV